MSNTQSSKSPFLGLMFCLTEIYRWPLMRCVKPENLAEHSHQVAIVSHLLAIILNKKFDGNVNPERCATAGLYHDSEEVITGDCPQPTKYFNPALTAEFKKLEHQAELSIWNSLNDPDLVEVMEEFIVTQSMDEDVKVIVKSADIICAYIKARDEYKWNNNVRFKDAYKKTRAMVQDRCEQYPEVKWFMDMYVDKMSASIDEMMAGFKK